MSADDLRPPALNTYDMRSNLTRVVQFLNGLIPLFPSDLGADSDNDWTDAAVVDAHAYTGYTYDYYFKRFGRRGLDNANIRILSLVHPVQRQDVFDAPLDVLFSFYLNAFYSHRSGVMVYGEGLPRGVYFEGQHWNYLSGALDIVAHELTHGVNEVYIES